MINQKVYEKESEEETNENIDNKKKAIKVVVEKNVVKVKYAALFAAKVMVARERNEARRQRGSSWD